MPSVIYKQFCESEITPYHKAHNFAWKHDGRDGGRENRPTLAFKGEDRKQLHNFALYF